MITKWRANDKYSYGGSQASERPSLSDLLCVSGYVRAETLAGFINGLFLLFISFFIFSEAVERLVEPPEVKHERLLVVSILGFFVNLVGIFVFQHGGAGHGHSHDGGGHGEISEISTFSYRKYLEVTVTVEATVTMVEATAMVTIRRLRSQ